MLVALQQSNRGDSALMDRRRNWTLWLALAAYFAVASAVTLRWPPWGDEVHYLSTIRLFGQGMSVDLLRTYPQMATPLAFVTYAEWGRLVGFETWQLRLLSPILAMSTCVLLAHALRMLGASTVMVTVGTGIIAANPYFLGLSTFVFTDTPALLMLAVAIVGVVSNRAWVTGAGIAGAVLTRQYLAFLTPAVIGAVLVSDGASGLWRSRHVLAACLALLPLAWFVWLWGGALAPVSEMRGVYLTGGGLRYDVHALSLYLAAPGIYLAPLLLWRAREGVSARALAIGFAMATVTLVFPVAPSAIQTVEGIVTVGFVHRLLLSLLPSAAVNIVWFLAAGFWLSVMLDRAFMLLTPAPLRRLDMATLFPWFGIAGFLLLMPFAYMPWEKYALPLFILSTLGLCAPANATLGMHARA
jgi:hypothetical protein